MLVSNILVSIALCLLVHGQLTVGKIHPEKMSKKDRDQSVRATRLLSNEAVDKSSTLTCPPCEQVHCRPRRPGRLRCKGGIALGICDCCPVCAKVEKETCGGHSNYLGKCDYGLYCEEQATQVLHYEQDGVKHVYHIAKGICKKVPNMKIPQNQDDFPPFCRPKCSSEFCLRNPKAICSAATNAESKDECQGPCFHTSCRACKFTEQITSCNKCHPDNFRCIRQFGKCIRKDVCSRHKYPCKIDVPENEERKMKFMCQVPECTDM